MLAWQPYFSVWSSNFAKTQLQNTKAEDWGLKSSPQDLIEAEKWFENQQSPLTSGLMSKSQNCNPAISGESCSALSDLFEELHSGYSRLFESKGVRFRKLNAIRCSKQTESDLVVRRLRRSSLKKWWNRRLIPCAIPTPKCQKPSRGSRYWIWFNR